MKENKLSYAGLAAKFKKIPRVQKIGVGIGLGTLIVLVALAVILLANRNKPEHSVASFCSYIKANQVPQDWKADVAYYKELEARAPSGVYEQTKTIRQTYEEMVKRPEAAVGLDLSITGTGSQFNDWISTNCYQTDSTNPNQSLQQWNQNLQKSLNSN